VGIEDGVRKRSTIQAYGLYPESDQNACRPAFGTVAGTVVDERTHHGIVDITDELIVQVDESYFDWSLKVARNWECEHELALLSRDCVEFVRAVGNALYLEMPRRTIIRMAPRLDHSLTVVAQKRLVDFAALTEPRASASVSALSLPASPLALSPCPEPCTKNRPQQAP
jgi:hypothetical protein